MVSRARWPLLALLALLACQAQAFILHLSEQQMNGLLTMSFPMTYTAGDYRITLSEPRVLFDNKARRVGLNAHMAVQDAQGREAFRGRGILSGEPYFDTQKRQLQLLRPRLDRLDVHQVRPEFEPVLEQTKADLLNQRLERILLIDLQSLVPYLPLQSMTSVRVGENALVLEF